MQILNDDEHKVHVERMLPISVSKAICTPMLANRTSRAYL